MISRGNLYHFVIDITCSFSQAKADPNGRLTPTPGGDSNAPPPLLRDWNAPPPLLQAVKSGNVPAIELLLEAKADPFIEYTSSVRKIAPSKSHFVTCIALCLLQKALNPPGNAVTYAVHGNHPELLERFVAMGVPADDRNWVTTERSAVSLLHSLCSHCLARFVCCLLRCCAFSSPTPSLSFLPFPPCVVVQNWLYRWTFSIGGPPMKWEQAEAIIKRGKALRRQRLEECSNALQDAFGGQPLPAVLCRIVAEYAV